MNPVLTALLREFQADLEHGLDAMGYALDHVGDFVHIRRTSERQRISFKPPVGPHAEELSFARVPPEKNSAYGVADRIWWRYRQLHQPDFGLEITLHKYLPLGSGMGSSAASSAAAAKAMLEILAFEYRFAMRWSRRSTLQM